ncbi:hypothetical protein Acr_23g0012720 [Actinidia rufa]|uniref:Uncharacterized protein n=1 Tax=Actinidia rufa TaxID=165716 RepID=A0A7J0GQ03_9ERIC|nr:hypothetical protein Acr_23g0012720 [Actinidia rufa]
MTREERFSEDISCLVGRGNRKKMNRTANHMLSNKMAVNLNMFSTIMKNIIVSNQYGTAIVTVKYSSPRMTDAHVLKKPSKLEELLCGVSKSTILSLSARMSNKSLLLTTPRDEGVA